MKKFRIKVDLSTFFDDERKLVCVLVDPLWESVKCLQQRVEKIFDVENLHFITEFGCFIPPQESIEVIQKDDVLKAFIPSTSKVKRKKKCEKHKETDYTEDSLELSKQIDKSGSKLPVENREQVKKRKLKSLGLACASSTPNQPKRSKHDAAVSLKMLSTVAPSKTAYEPPTSTNEHLGGILDKQKRVNKLLESRTEAQEKSLDKSCNVVSEKEANVSSPVLRKRKRKYKKRIESTPEDEEPQTGHIEKAKISDSSSIKPSSTILNEFESKKNNKSPMRSTTNSKSHLHFIDTGEAVTTTTPTQNNTSALEKSSNKSVAKIFFRCDVAKMPLNTPRKFVLKKCEDTKSPEIENVSTDVMNKANSTKLSTDITNGVNSTPSKAKPIIEIKEHIVIAPIKFTTVLDEKCDEASMTIEEESKAEETVPMAYNLITDDDNNNGETMEGTNIVDDASGETMEGTNLADDSSGETMEGTTNIADDSSGETMEDTNIADDSSIIALDSEDENGDATDQNGSDAGSNEDNNTKVRSKQKQNSPDVSEVIDLNATDEESDSIFEGRKASLQQYKDFIKGNKSIQDILPFTTVLEDLPSVGDVIVFKIRRLDNKITDYISGKCMYTNKRVKTIKLESIDKLKDIDFIPDRYKCFLESSNPDNRSLTIKRCEMIEARVFKV